MSKKELDKRVFRRVICDCVDFDEQTIKAICRKCDGKRELFEPIGPGRLLASFKGELREHGNLAGLSHGVELRGIPIECAKMAGDTVRVLILDDPEPARSGDEGTTKTAGKEVKT